MHLMKYYYFKIRNFGSSYSNKNNEYYSSSLSTQQNPLSIGNTQRPQARFSKKRTRVVHVMSKHFPILSASQPSDVCIRHIMDLK